MVERIKKLLDKMRFIETPAFDQAVGIALLFDNTELTSSFANALIGRESEIAFGYLLRAYHKLPETLKQRFLNYAPSISSLLRSLAREEDLQVKRNIIEVIKQTKHPKLIYVLALMLTDENPFIRASAARTFEELTILLADVIFESKDANREKRYPCRGLETPEELAESVGGFFAALEIAIDSFHIHLRTEIVRSAMIFGPLLPEKILERFDSYSPWNKIARTAIEILNKRTDPRFAGFVFKMLKSKEVSKIYIRLISTTRNEGFVRRLLRYSWLRFDPDIKSQLKKLKDFEWIKNNYQTLLAFSPELQIRFIDLLLTTNLPASDKLAVLKVLLVSNSYDVHLAVVAALKELGSPQAYEVLRKVPYLREAIDFSPLAIELAQRFITREPEFDLGEKLETQFDDRVHILEGEKYFELAWTSLDKLEPEEWKLVLNRLRRLDNDFNKHLGEKLNSVSPDEKIRALLLIRRGNLIDEYLPAIYTLCKDRSPEVRSAAILTLAQSRNPSVKPIVVEALDDKDPRVQANAVEALELLNPPDLLETLEEKISSSNNRIRANAIKAILRPQFISALRALSSMLDHPDPIFRRSALWALKQITPRIMIKKIAKLAMDDPANDVRAMAKDVLKIFAGDNVEGSGSPSKKKAMAKK